MRWVLVGIIGFTTGIVAFLIDITVKELFKMKYGFFDKGWYTANEEQFFFVISIVSCYPISGDVISSVLLGDGAHQFGVGVYWSDACNSFLTPPEVTNF